jgi:hypothetical protein
MRLNILLNILTRDLQPAETSKEKRFRLAWKTIFHVFKKIIATLQTEYFNVLQRRTQLYVSNNT